MLNQKGFATLIFVVMILVISFLVIGTLLLLKNNLVKTTQSPTQVSKLSEKSSSLNPVPKEASESSELINNGSEIKMVGKITATYDGCSYDDSCHLTVNGKIIFVGGGLTPNSAIVPKGQLIGYTIGSSSRYIGKKVEVYAKVLKDNFLTIDGSKDYYVKMLEE